MNPIINLLSRIPVWVEMVFVLSLCFGLLILSSVISFLHSQVPNKIEFDTLHGIAILVWEIPIMLLVAVFLKARGFSVWLSVRWAPTLKATAVGFGLCIATYIAYAIVFFAAALALGHENLHIAEISMRMPLWLVVAVSFVNPIFEETFVVGYLFERGRYLGIITVIALSCVLRLSYHLYQGWFAIVLILPFAVLCALIYAKTRNLWPLVLAHAVLDFLGLAVLSN
jgi:uncharacterized protein